MKVVLTLVVFTFLLLFIGQVSSLPCSHLGPYVKYVSDSTITHYTNNTNELTYLFIYNHNYVCLKCPHVGSLVSRMAKEFSGQVNFIAIDAVDKHSIETISHLQMDPESTEFPVVLRYPISSEWPLGQPVFVDLLDLKTFRTDIIDFIQVHSDVKHLTTQNSKRLLSFKTSPLPKVVLFTTKQDIPSIWASLSHQFAGKMSFFLAQKTDRRLTKRFGIDTYPSIALLRRVDFNADLSDDEIEPIIFPGQMKAPLIHAWLSMYSDLPSYVTQSEESMALYTADLISEQTSMLPLVTDQRCFEGHCTQHPESGLCAILVTPSLEILTPELVQNVAYQLTVTNSLNDLRRETGLHWMVVPGNNDHDSALHLPSEGQWPYYVQPGFFATFGISPQTYPQLVLYDPRKHSAASFHGSFEPGNILTWVDDILQGKSGLTPISTVSDSSALAATSFLPSTPSRCENIFVEREQQRVDAESLKKRDSMAASGTSVPTDPLADAAGVPQDEFHVWPKPYRPLGRRGQLRAMTDALWHNQFLHRSVGVLLQFLDRPAPTRLADGTVQKVTYLAKEDDRPQTDLDVFNQVVESLQGMIEGYYIECVPESAKVRALFGVEKCDGLVISIPPRVRITPEYRNLTFIETQLAHESTILEPAANELTIDHSTGKTLRSFSFETLRKIGLSLLDGIKPTRLSNNSDALQNWLMESLNEPRVLIFTKKDDVPMAKALLVEFHQFARVALVGPDHDALIHQFQVESLPAVRILRPFLQPHIDPGNENPNARKLQIQLIPLAPHQLYYNAVAGQLDHLVGVRQIGTNTLQGQTYEPIRKLHPAEELFMQHRASKKDEL